MDNQESADTFDSSLEGLQTQVLSRGTPSGTAPREPLPHRSHKIPLRVIIITIAVLLLIGLGMGITMLALHTASNATKKTVIINTQSLDNGTLNKLNVQSEQNGQVQQQLTIAPSTLFKNDVVIQQTAIVQKDLTVEGKSKLIGSVATGSDLAVGGGISVARNATVGGSLSVSGQISAGSLNVGKIAPSTIVASGDISLGGHLIFTGTPPTAKPDLAAGSGTVAISGSDSSGTITINTGGNNLAAGELAIVNFHNPYGLAPRIQLTPVNQAAATLPYYVGSHATFFQINSASSIAANTSYQFFYFVTQ